MNYDSFSLPNLRYSLQSTAITARDKYGWSYHTSKGSYRIESKCV